MSIDFMPHGQAPRTSGVCATRYWGATTQRQHAGFSYWCATRRLWSTQCGTPAEADRESCHSDGYDYAVQRKEWRPLNARERGQGENA